MEPWGEGDTRGCEQGPGRRASGGAGEGDGDKDKYWAGQKVRLVFSVK